MNDTTPTVFVIDDDTALCESLQWLLEAEGFRVQAYHSADAFYEAFSPGHPGCVVLDVRMPGMSGLELHNKLRRDNAGIPVIMITGHGDIPMAVRAMRNGALDFLEKPVPVETLVQRIRQAIAYDASRRSEHDHRAEILRRIESLTAREREVMEHVVIGQPNKQTATELGITEKTVEVHRKRVMHKMGAATAIELVRMVLAARDGDAPPDYSPPSGSV